MPTETAALDPAWAWSCYEPSEARPWNIRLAAHLFRRAGFSASRAALQAAVSAGPAQAIERLLLPEAETQTFDSESQTLANSVLATGDPQQLSAWWVYVLLRTPHPLQERMTLFWHSHFATSAAKVQDATAMYNQNRLLRQHAIGDFRQLA